MFILDIRSLIEKDLPFVHGTIIIFLKSMVLAVSENVLSCSSKSVFIDKEQLSLFLIFLQETPKNIKNNDTHNIIDILIDPKYISNLFISINTPDNYSTVDPEKWTTDKV